MLDFGWRAPAMALVPLMLAACASEPPPASLQAARVQVGQATAPTPDAQLHLQEAREKLNAAEQAAASDDMAEADMLAQEALANAQLARASVQAAEAEQACATSSARFRRCAPKQIQVRLPPPPRPPNPPARDRRRA